MREGKLYTVDDESKQISADYLQKVYNRLTISLYFKYSYEIMRKLNP